MMINYDDYYYCSMISIRVTNTTPKEQAPLAIGWMLHRYRNTLLLNMSMDDDGDDDDEDKSVSWTLTDLFVCSKMSGRNRKGYRENSNSPVGIQNISVKP